MWKYTDEGLGRENKIGKENVKQKYSIWNLLGKIIFEVRYFKTVKNIIESVKKSQPLFNLLNIEFSPLAMSETLHNKCMEVQSMDLNIYSIQLM